MSNPNTSSPASAALKLLLDQMRLASQSGTNASSDPNSYPTLRLDITLIPPPDQQLVIDGRKQTATGGPFSGVTYRNIPLTSENDAEPTLARLLEATDATLALPNGVTIGQVRIEHPTTQIKPVTSIHPYTIYPGILLKAVEDTQGQKRLTVAPGANCLRIDGQWTEPSDSSKVVLALQQVQSAFHKEWNQALWTEGDPDSAAKAMHLSGYLESQVNTLEDISNGEIFQRFS